MKSWPDLFTECIQAYESAAGVRLGSRVRAEVAFHLSVSADTTISECGDEVPSAAGSAVRVFSRDNAARGLTANADTLALGVAIRPTGLEDLCILFSERGSKLILETLPQGHESTVLLASVSPEVPIQRGRLMDGVSRVEFAGLSPGSYLVVLFPMEGAEALYESAQALRDNGHRADALVKLERALQLDSEFAEAWTRKAYVLREMDLRDKALAAIDQALRANPDYALAWRCKGAILRDQGKHEKGLDCYLRSLQLDPTDFLCWQNKGNALSTLDREEEAKAAYAEAERIQALFPEEKR